MTTILSLRNTGAAFVRRRNRWETAVRIPIEVEIELHDELIEPVVPSRVRNLARRFQQIFSERPLTD